MFIPNEIIFSVTTKCNLKCKHCYVTQNNQFLDITKAKNFIHSCITQSIKNNLPTIESIGFTGGEPFLYLDFLTELSTFAVNENLYFDSITTNGIFWNTQEELTDTLQKLYNSGYDGKIQISFDSFHNQNEEKIAIFIKEVFSIFNNPTMIKILSVSNNDKNKQKSFLDKLTNLSTLLNAKLRKNGSSIILEDKNNKSSLYIPVIQFNQSFQSTDIDAWKSKKWFTEDFCEGPGNILYIHSNGSIAPCCGFANENKELSIGTIDDSYSTIIKNAKNNKYINTCFSSGLEKLRKEMETNNYTFPGKTQDICTFCDYICKRKL